MTPFDPRLPLIAADARVKTCHVYHCWCALKEMGRNFHADAFAAFAGLEQKHVAAILSAIEAHGAVPGGRATSTRGQRLPIDFKMPQDWLDWASRERCWEPSFVKTEADSFIDHWHAKSGRDAAKLDWFATWRNWVRAPFKTNGEYRPAKAVPTETRAEQLQRTIRVYEAMGRDGETGDMRRELASLNNVISFDFVERKTAVSGG